MAPARTAWHLGFTNLVVERGPPAIDVWPEVLLSIEPQRADLLLLRRTDEPRRDHEARVLRLLWPLLGTDTLIEFKSPVRPPRKGDLLRLLAYGAVYHAAQALLDRLDDPRELTLVLVVASLTPALQEEIDRMGWTVQSLGKGYGRLDAGVYATYLVVTDEVAPAERDAFLAIFSHLPVVDPEARRWFERFLGHTRRTENIEQLEGYREMEDKFLESLPPERRMAGLTPAQMLPALPVEVLRALSEQLVDSLPPEQRMAGIAPEQRMAGIAPEQRMAGIAPEQRMAGLSPEEVLPALPVEVLRGFSDEYLRSLPPDVADKIRQRLGR